jgi:hypothetical protein
MKKSLLFIFLLIFSFSLYAQKDTLSFIGAAPKDILKDAASINVSIYPVPVRENTFTVKAERDISFIKVTNIIGQDILRIPYNSPEQLVKIVLDNPKRGIYLVTILFSDGARVVKKIMVEESE